VAIKNDFAAYLPGSPFDATEQALLSLMFNDFLDSTGPNGLTKFGGILRIATADCSDCGCGWCYTYHAADGAFIWAGEDYPGEYSHTILASGIGWSITRDSNAGCPCSPVGVLNAAGTIPTHVDDVYITVHAPDFVGAEPVDCYMGFGNDITPGTFASASSVGNWTGEDTVFHLHPNMDATDMQIVFNFNHYDTDLSKRVFITKILIQGTGDAPFGTSTC
jgi:hypothetical protein